MLFSTLGLWAQSISYIETTKSWYYIYDQDGKKIKTLSTSQGELKGYSSTFYIIKQGSAFYVTYDVNGKRLHTFGAAVPFNELSKMKPGEPSSSSHERVIKARLIQEERFKNHKGVHCNAQMTERMLHMYAEPDEASLDMLRLAMEKLSLSARAYSRILKVARTIADLEGTEKVQS